MTPVLKVLSHPTWYHGHLSVGYDRDRAGEGISRTRNEDPLPQVGFTFDVVSSPGFLTQTHSSATATAHKKSLKKSQGTRLPSILQTDKLLSDLSMFRQEECLIFRQINEKMSYLNIFSFVSYQLKIKHFKTCYIVIKLCFNFVQPFIEFSQGLHQ